MVLCLKKLIQLKNTTKWMNQKKSSTFLVIITKVAFSLSGATFFVGSDIMDNIDLNLFKTFYIVAKCKSFTKAAEQLYVSQPAITRSIKKLEDQLNAELFKREANGISLTEVGEAVYYYAENLCNFIDANSNLIKNVKESAIKEINIGVPTHIGAFYLINVLKKFNKKFPFTKVNIINKRSDEMLVMLEKRELDIVIDTGMTFVESNTLMVKRIMNLKGCFVGNEKFREVSENGPIQPTELKNYPLILPGRVTSNRRMIDYYFGEKNIVLNPLIEVNSSSISKKIINEGIGIGWMIKEFIQKDIDDKELFEINVEIEDVEIPLSIAYHNRFVSDYVKEFIKIIFDKKDN